MRALTLIRHAKSSWKDSRLSDFERPLNARGRDNAPMMGARLKQQGVCFDLIVSSPARRAQDTARLIAAALGYAPQRIRLDSSIYEATVAQLMRVIHALPGTCRDVALIGHNPGITSLCDYLSGAGSDNLPTCASARIEFEQDSWEALWRDTGRLVRYDYPRRPAD